MVKKNGDVWSRSQVTRILTEKNLARGIIVKKEIELTIQDIRDNIPLFEKHGEIFLLRWWRKNWPGFWAWDGSDLPQKTPIENLYNVGDGVLPNGWTGLPGVARTARTAYFLLHNLADCAIFKSWL